MTDFPNGFDSWIETYFEVVSGITQDILSEDSKCNSIVQKNGFTILYELAKELTNEFEVLHKDRFWDGEFLDYIYEFLKTKLNELSRN